MGIRTLTLYDVPDSIRVKGAANARKQIQQLLANPQLTAEQRKELQAQLRWTGNWERLNIKEVLPQKPSENHSVELVESLAVTEG